MKRSSVFLMIVAVVVLMAALSGCTSTNSPPAVQVTNTPAITVTPAPTTAVTILPATTTVAEPDPEAIADKKFADATEACYSANPVISNVATQQAFVSCIQNTPEPKGLCALNYKNNILKYTKEDDTSAGYLRENTRLKLARDAYRKNLSYNYLTDQAEACSRLPMNRPV